MTDARDGGARMDAGAHRFYDSRIAVSAFCLACLAAIFWQVSRFEGFQPIFRCGDWAAMDRVVLDEGMGACMAGAHGRAEQERCMRTVHILACMKEVWR